ncbi:M15 family metallopeptidase [Paenibacillus wulumuqiensis]|uniref:M15 family metallopeptidase n=1 Tax=Paenibacillus wulumuqiensis TaxID=1567107 RepID=UPI000619CE94|nr:M15 family metallopeptidase [Paenibacillus wulumuqiensis]
MALTLEQVKRKSASRLATLNSVWRLAAEAVIERAYNRGVYIVLVQALRTYAEQDALYVQGRNGDKRNIVTNARGGYSNHNFGCAIDFALLNADGTQVSWDTKRDWDNDGVRDWMEVVEEAKKLGWSWGGDWKTFVDMPHFEMTFGLSTADYRVGRRPMPAQLRIAEAKINSVMKSEIKTEDDGMTAAEKKAFEELQAKAEAAGKATAESAALIGKLTERIAYLEGRDKMAKLPEWSIKPFENAKAAGVVNNANESSYDICRVVTMLDRLGAFKTDTTKEVS